MLATWGCSTFPKPTLSLDFAGATSLDSGITFTRATTATYFNSSGVLTTADSGVARFDYSPSTLQPLGLLIEEQRTNLLLHNRDLTNVAWTASNVTAAKNQTGIDGVASSASLITASADNGTILQAVTSASAARATTAYVKRITGTGVIEMTQNGGTTWAAVTVTSAWTRVSIASATVTNPSVGFRIATNGDAIAVDCVQLENGAFATSVIPTTTTALTRNADVASMTGTNFSSWYNASEGTVVWESQTAQGANAYPWSLFGSSTSNRIYANYLTNQRIQSGIRTNGTFEAAQDTPTNSAPINTFGKGATAYKVNDFGFSWNGAAALTDTTLTLPTVQQLDIGNNGTLSGNYINGYIRRIAYYPTRLPDTTLQALTA